MSFQNRGWLHASIEDMATMPWVWFGKWDDGHEKDTPIRTGALFIVLCLFYVFMCVFLVFIVLFFSIVHAKQADMKKHNSIHLYRTKVVHRHSGSANWLVEEP